MKSMKRPALLPESAQPSAYAAGMAAMDKSTSGRRTDRGEMPARPTNGAVIIASSGPVVSPFHWGSTVVSTPSG